MSYTLKFVCDAGNRKIYEISEKNQELESSYLSRTEFRQLNPLDISRHEKRKKLDVVIYDKPEDRKTLRKVKENSDGSVDFD